jgi:hypothetical protein
MPNNFVLHMGFLNTPYTKQAIAAPMAAAKAHEAKSRRHYSKTKTTQSVANILENKYGILEKFMELYEDDITDIIHEKLDSFIIQSLSEKRKVTSERMVQYMKPNTVRIEKMFRGFLDRDETGETVKAAMKRSKPPFIRTGLYRASFRSWVDTK